MSPEEENKLFQLLGNIEGKLDALKASLEAHTASDSENFEALDAQLKVIDIRAAHEAGAKEAVEKAGGKAGMVWGSAAGFIVTIITQVVSNIVTGNR